MKKMIKIVVLFFIIFNLSACGYKPSAKFARQTLGDKISTSVVISSQDPANTVIMKDAVDSAIIKIFQASLIDKSKSDTHLVLSMGNPGYSPIVYDVNGYVVGYRMTIILTIARTNSGVTKRYTAKGNHDFEITPNAIISDQQRFEAIGFSVEKAIRSFIAQVSAEGARSE
jgi:hypothetical protein